MKEAQDSAAQPDRIRACLKCGKAELESDVFIHMCQTAGIVPDPPARAIIDNLGHDDLWGWFGLSYATFLTLPRVLMHEMPDEWQGKMAVLLREYDEFFPNRPALGTRVQVTQDGKLTKHPDWMLNYRHPDYDEITKMKAGCP